MSETDIEPETTAAAAEADALRERIARLEREHAEEVARLQAALARAQDRAYWLDRWHIDLNRWMATRNGERFRGAVRALRTVVRGGRMAVRKARSR